MVGPHFPRHVENYSGFIDPDFDVLIQTSNNADYTTQVDKRYVTSSKIVSLIVTGMLLVQLTFITLVFPTFGCRPSLMELAVSCAVFFFPVSLDYYLTGGRYHQQILNPQVAAASSSGSHFAVPSLFLS